MKQAFIMCLCCLCVILTVLATSTKTIVNTDTIRIEQKGHRFAVYDLLTDSRYNLVFVRRRLSEGQIKPTVLILTDTIRIERITEGFQAISNGMVYQITRKKGGVLIWQKKYLMKRCLKCCLSMVV